MDKSDNGECEVSEPKNSNIAVLTSGGDCQGMNAAVRAVVRMGFFVKSDVYMVYEGYKGLILGGEHIKLAQWYSVSGIIHKGGTILGSSRCKEFRTIEGRKKAALNLIKRNINNLVVIGGDGSLTGADKLRSEWSNFVEDFNKDGLLTPEEYILKDQFSMAGIVGSIDNDFCGTDMTIGADSALHRIIEAIDHISTTAFSHQRCFIMQVMGRNCGYLALTSAIASGADWVFVPEDPPMEGWEDRLCKKLLKERECGRRLNIIILAEGAITRDGTPIRHEMIQELVERRCQFDTRVTILGHVQRGGNPSAFDRILATRMGAEAVMTLADPKFKNKSWVISLEGNRIVHGPLEGAVAKTLKIKEAYQNRDYSIIGELRSHHYMKNLRDYYANSRNIIKNTKLGMYNDETRPRILILNVGAPACGINACVHVLSKLFLLNDMSVYHLKNGFRGFLNKDISKVELGTTNYWMHEGGSILGIHRLTAEKIGFENISNVLKEYSINSIIIVGGYDALISGGQLERNRSNYEAFRIPIAVIPATISNHVPGSYFSLGADTALNEITYTCDRLKQCAIGSDKRIFLIETHGAFCGYLATMAGLSSGADASYIFEEKFDIHTLISDAQRLINKMKNGKVKRGIILRCEKCNKNYDIEFMEKLFKEVGKDVFDVRTNIIGHIQQGGTSSPFDRILATKYANKTFNFITNLLENKQQHIGHDSAFITGLISKNIQCTPIIEALESGRTEYRIPKDQWWLTMRGLLKILAKHEN